MNVIGIDSDTKNAGIAYFEDGKLLECTIATDILDLYKVGYIPEWHPQYIIVETPQITKEWTRRGVSPDGIVKLSRYAGIIGTFFGMVYKVPVKYILPNTWKGTIPKDISQQRIIDKWGNIEKYLIPTLPKARTVNKSQYTHVIDAIGIADWFCIKSKLGVYDHFFLE